MRPWQQPAARQRDDASGEPGRVERQRDIDHRQSGADQQNGIVGGQTGDHRRVPRVGRIDIAGQHRRVEPGRRVRRQVANGDDECVDPSLAAAGQPDADPIVTDLDRHRFVVDQRQPLARARRRALEQLAEVLAVLLPLDKTAAVAHPPRRAPLGEVRRAIAQRAHVAGADVEQVRRMRRGIRRPPPEHRPPLDQRRCRSGMTQQVDREQRAGEACADNGDATINHGTTSLSPRGRGR